MSNPPQSGKSASRAPSGVSAELGWLYSFAKDTTETQLRVERTPEQIIKLTSKLERLAEREINSIHQKISSLGEAGAHLMPACRKGCWYCCTHLVTATVPEVINIANHIRQNWSDDEIASLRDRISQHKIATQPLRDGVEGFVPRHACPLLQDGACTVWTSRPLTCRGWNSVSVDDCREKMEHPESGIRERALAHQMAVADFVRQGLEEGLSDSKANGLVCDLAYALEIALDNPDAAERYLAGDDIFAPARAGLETWT